MADRVEVLITGDSSGLVRAADQASSAMAGFGASASKLSSIASAFKSDFGQMTAAFATANVAVGAIVGAFDSAARAVQAMNAEVIDAERVSAKLTATFAGAEGAAARLTAQAEALAGSTVFFDDDAIKSAAAALRAFDLTEKQISQLLPVAVNLATVFGTDLDSAAQKLALGLNGSTRGLREFGIVTKEGATQAEVMAEILKRGEQAAKGATTAQSGLRGATEGLKKAQGEFNQALGNLLAGPQAGFLNFLSSAINKATELTGALSGVASATLAVSKVINPKTGQIEAGPAVPTVRPGQRFGEIPGLPMSATGRALAERVLGVETAGGGLQKPVKEPEAPRAPRAARMSPKPAAQEMLGPGIELLQNYQRQQLENLINANIRAGEEQLKFTAAAEDLADERQKTRNQELSKTYDEAAARSSEILQSGIRGIGDAISGLISGRTNFGGLANQIAELLGGAIGGPVGSALASAGTSIASAIFDRMSGISSAQRQAAERMNEAADRMYESATKTDAAFESAQRTFLEKTGAMTTEQAKKEQIAAQGARNIVETLGIGAGDPRLQESRRKELETALLAAGNLDQTALMDALKKGPQSTIEFLVKNGLMDKGLGGSLIVTGLSGQADQFAKAFSTVLFNMFPSLDSKTGTPGTAAPGSPTAEEAAQLGDSARNPVYVFDVSPSKDEFTRAPRGLFFRPVGMGRAVNTGQNLAASGL